MHKYLNDLYKGTLFKEMGRWELLVEQNNWKVSDQSSRGANPLVGWVCSSSVYQTVLPVLSAKPWVTSALHAWTIPKRRGHLKTRAYIYKRSMRGTKIYSEMSGSYMHGLYIIYVCDWRRVAIYWSSCLVVGSKMVVEFSKCHLSEISIPLVVLIPLTV